MRCAIDAGKKALPGCLPNPPVGCVLVSAGEIIATGYTNTPGQPHAEAMALAQISGDLSHVSVYVTLEPCSFHGRTPACAKNLIARNVKEVFVGIIDPDPRNNGAGIALLRDAGIEVHLGLLGDLMKQHLAPYLYSAAPQ